MRRGYAARQPGSAASGLQFCALSAVVRRPQTHTDTQRETYTCHRGGLEMCSQVFAALSVHRPTEPRRDPSYLGNACSALVLATPLPHISYKVMNCVCRFVDWGGRCGARACRPPQAFGGELVRSGAGAFVCDRLRPAAAASKPLLVVVMHWGWSWLARWAAQRERGRDAAELRPAQTPTKRRLRGLLP